MSRKVKEMVEKELHGRYASLESALVVDVSKLSGVQANTLRGKLRSHGVEMHVVKNRATRRALSESKIKTVGAKLTGPCALVTGGSSVIEVAKELMALLKDYPAIILKGGVVDGAPDYLPVEKVAAMRSRIEILGDVAALISGPGRRLAGCLASPGGRVAGCLKAIVDKGEKAAPALEPVNA